ncbi:MAG TPA: NADH-ubiquinone oxidoreductase-F iron-sulfur binding region domain-containing protein [Candidatus Polarisedimenticolia bacterium]|nr:NADH-ubiquinone oxidoreductase-F iron-sulfur binding region domain-containing protein [Candidatus Polarisedimenticolia bacterium]
MIKQRLLAGPDLSQGPERLASHVQRLGPPPSIGPALIDVVEHSGLTGRGGAAFPVGAKWRAIARVQAQEPVVVVNGAEGEPRSLKDQVLMTARPHLVLDGAILAARALKTCRIEVVIGESHHAARGSMSAALAERPEPELRQARIVIAPARYVAGESSAIVHLVGSGIARPTSRPPSMHEAGVDGRPTLVQNIESLAHVALIARYGAGWFGPGTVLITAVGAVSAPGVLEVESGTSVREVFKTAGGGSHGMRAILLGGYFGAWVGADQAWDLPLDPVVLRGRGLTLGCGVVGFLHDAACGVCETARIMRYLASESSAQCGPCFFGLRALADAIARIGEPGSNTEDLARLHRWSQEVSGRGACRHPDGAVMLLRSALAVFAEEFANHPPHWRVEPSQPRRIA